MDKYEIMQYYVYVLIDPRDDVPFYVGKGKNKRSHDHLREARLGKCKNKHLERKIVQIWNAGHGVKIKLMNLFEDESEAYAFEANTIASIGRMDLGTGSLVNLTEGGEGIQGKSQESVRKSIAKMMTTKAAWSEEERDNFAKSAAASAKSFWERLTIQEKQERTQHIRDYYGGMSIGDKESLIERCRQQHNEINTPEWRAKISETCKRLWNDPLARRTQGDLIRCQKAKMTIAAKTQHRENVREAVRRQWAAMTPEQKNARMAKIRSGIKKRDKAS